jgi:Protein of unknown function (DUF4446)
MAMSTFFSNLSTLQIALLVVFSILQLFFLISLSFLLIRNKQQEKKLALFFGNKEARDLESILVEQLSEIRVLDQEIQELFEVSNRLRDLSLKTIHRVSVERFNPFKEVGSNQSFCVALLDGKNTGLVLSSLHTREGTRVYAKPVYEGQAKGFPFTEEEKQTVIKAIHSHK